MCCQIEINSEQLQEPDEGNDSCIFKVIIVTLLKCFLKCFQGSFYYLASSRYSTQRILLHNVSNRVKYYYVILMKSFSDRSYLRITEQEFTSLPVDVRILWKIENFLSLWHLQVLIQGIVSLFVVMYGVMSVAGEFKEIRATVDLETKSWETQRNLSSFYTFNHRGKSLSAFYVPHGKTELDEVE